MTIWLTCYRISVDRMGFRVSERRNEFNESFESIDLAVEYMNRICKSNSKAAVYAFEVEVQE